MGVRALFVAGLLAVACGGTTPPPPATIDAAPPAPVDASPPGTDAAQSVGLHGEEAAGAGAMEGGLFKLRGVLGPRVGRTPMTGGEFRMSSGTVVKP